MRKKITALFSAADREKAQPILDALRAKGFRIAEDEADRAGGAVLLFLSAAFAADEQAQERFFARESAGREIIPVDLDGAAQPELVKTALIAKNAIAAQGRTAEEIAERISSAEAFREKKSPLPKLLIAAAALLLTLGAGIWLWRAGAPKEPEAAPEPTAEAPALPDLDSFGLSAADLEKIGSMVIIGDRVYPYTIDQYSANYYYPEWTDYASVSREADGQHYYSFEDGGEIPLTRYDDLGVLALMPKLTRLTLVGVETEKMPSLAALDSLESVQIYNCSVGGCAWLAGTNITNVAFGSSDVSDFSPLSECKKLRNASINIQGGAESDFSGFAPPNLKELRLWSNYDTALELSALSACKAMRTVELFNLSVRDLDFLSGSDLIAELTISGLHELGDISALGRMRNLQKLSVYDCPRLSDISALGSLNALEELNINSNTIRDFSPIGRCGKLQTVSLCSDTLHDASFLAGLSKLFQIELQVNALQNVDFLREISPASAINLKLQGSVADYSGLEAVSRYNGLILIPNGPTLDRALPYLQGADEIKYLELFHLKPSDWALVPKPSQSLGVFKSDRLRNLEGFPAWELGRIDLKFSDLPHLRSLQGIEAASGLDSGMPAIEVRGCPVFTELGLPKGTVLRQLTLADTLIAPSLQGLSLYTLRLENIVELEDLGCLVGLDTARRCSFELVGLDKLTDLSMLGHFRGDTLTVPPQLEEQAEELCQKECFRRWYVAYPEGGWQANDVEVVLESLDELETMPKALLRHVRSLVLAGDRLVEPRGAYGSYEKWDNKGHVIPMLQLDGEEIEMGRGALKDLSALTGLTGLEELVLWNQPLESIDGIQAFAELRRLEIRWCGELRDVSPAFTLQNLGSISLHGSRAESIQGVQNLPELISLDLSYSAVTDLSPLAEGSFDTAAREWGGLRLDIQGVSVEDYGALGAIGCPLILNVEGADSERWADGLDGAELKELLFFHSDFDGESFAAFVRKHPELRVLWMPWNESIDDLTALLELPELERVDVSYTMEKAVQSLEGKKFGFELIVEQPN